MTRKTTIVAAVTAALLSILAATPAHAELLRHEKFAFTDSDTFNDCGPTIEHTITGSGLTSVRTVAGTDQAYLGWANATIVETFTNPANGYYFTISTHVLTRDTSATHVDGDIWMFTDKDSGQLFTVTDDTGRVLYRDTGTVKYTQLFDTLGDHEPGGFVIEETLIALDGHFSGDVDLCTDLVGPLLS